jgi:hypothetical protein
MEVNEGQRLIKMERQSYKKADVDAGRKKVIFLLFQYVDGQEVNIYLRLSKTSSLPSITWRLARSLMGANGY